MPGSRTLNLAWTICIAFLVIAGFFLLTEHRAHAFGVLPYLLLLACPLLHLLHRSHGKQAHAGGGHQHAPPPEKGGPA